MTNNPLVSIVIPCYNQAKYLPESITRCLLQDYENLEIIVFNDASSDEEFKKPLIKGLLENDRIKVFSSREPSGTGEAFNKAIKKSTGEYIILLCADDYFTHSCVVPDVVRMFQSDERIAHVTRYYYQFIDGDDSPVRAWRCNKILELANNPSGLAFRRKALRGCKLTNKMFVESANLVYEVMQNKEYLSAILPWDTVAVRIHDSTARSPEYYKKRWTSSPIEEWSKLGARSLLKDYLSLVQIKAFFEKSAVHKEAQKFIELNPECKKSLHFWAVYWATMLTPKPILKHLPRFYHKTIGRLTTRRIDRGRNGKRAAENYYMHTCV